MKKLILATLVAATFSSAAMAGGMDVQNPDNNLPLNVPVIERPISVDMDLPFVPDNNDNLILPTPTPDMPESVVTPTLRPIPDAGADTPVHTPSNEFPVNDKDGVPERPMSEDSLNKPTQRPVPMPTMPGDGNERPDSDPINVDTPHDTQLDKTQQQVNENHTAIGVNSDRIDTNASGVASNKATNERQDKDIAANRQDIDFNKQAIQNLEKEVDRLDDRIDGTQASLHAVTNARPFLSGAGKTAVGVGIGFAGDSSAVAVGAAHAFTSQWSASATMNVVTGNGDADFSAGVGTQYEF